MSASPFGIKQLDSPLSAPEQPWASKKLHVSYWRKAVFSMEEAKAEAGVPSPASFSLQPESRFGRGLIRGASVAMLACLRTVPAIWHAYRHGRKHHHIDFYSFLSYKAVIR
jgi:hypothetical protein